MDAESAKSAVAQLGEQALRDLYANLTGMKAFVLDQAPDVCRQMINWQIATACAALLAFFIAIPLAWLAWKKISAIEDEPIIIGPGLAATMVLIPLGVFVHEAIYALQAIVAPKLFLIEHIAAMLKGAS